MVLDTQDYWVSGFCPLSGILKKLENTTFRRLDLYRPQMKGDTPILFGPSERANLSH
jgi:hypothetical protein